MTVEFYSQCMGSEFFLMFRYSEKTTKIWPILHSFLSLLSSVELKVEDEPNFCGLLRISELYNFRHKSIEFKE